MKNTDELLRDAFAIIDGIPQAQIAFGAPCSARGPSLRNGTICSPEGWLAQHPQFQALGLSLSADGRGLRVHGREDASSPAAAMAEVFGLPPYEAAQLFGERSVFTAGDDSGLSDKELWQQRLRDFLSAERLAWHSIAGAAPEPADIPAQGAGGAQPASDWQSEAVLDAAGTEGDEPAPESVDTPLADMPHEAVPPDQPPRELASSSQVP
ncbi:hypothetical protein SAMN06265795_1226 [Noviherbaspirillum humi]|uniref:Uncharacterized protein n=1 Tax=Noviherbaspirillum humi TaxID=1688639 RepID=A0A239LFP0_9BURK|nr:hypothetical protein [Noviherbaspirillum humi]SNT28459.1 hypothetical protein SAMN06265795_1226 [Noviherbaspirillum humi]